MDKLVDKTVNLNLVGLDGNAFNLMGKFQRAAHQQGWTPEEIKLVMNECQSADYDHLVQTLVAHTDTCTNEDYEDQ